MLNRARGERHPCWKGGINKHASGYTLIMSKDHPRANRDGYVMEHILVAEKAVGCYLPDGVEVHHVNGAKSDNSTKNLVICQDHQYHLLLHYRQKAILACGNPNALHCKFCKTWGVDGFIYLKSSRSYAHRSCENSNQIERYLKRKAITRGTR